VKKLLIILAGILLSASPALASGFSVFGSYADTTDAGDTFGGGVGVSFPLGGGGLGLDLRATCYQEVTDEGADAIFDDDEELFEEDSLEILPIDAGLRYQFNSDGPVNPWIGGGFSYFLLDTTRQGLDVDDETGYYVSVGSRFGDPHGVGFFAETLYRSTEATLGAFPLLCRLNRAQPQRTLHQAGR
jgi:hypothetical protein